MTRLDQRVAFDAELFLWSGGNWHFVRLPAEAAEDVRDLADEFRQGPPRGFGSVRVAVRLGESRWKTSVFPEKDTGSYLLPVKKPVRDAEGIDAGDVVHVELEIEPDNEEGTP